VKRTEHGAALGDDGKLRSTCHGVYLGGALGDGVLYGFCSECWKPIVRLNPKTGRKEWLDGEEPWTKKRLRTVQETSR
jgi:hypothetical protein